MRSISLCLLIAVAACGSTTVGPHLPAPIPVSAARARIQASIVAATGLEAATLLAAVAASLEHPAFRPAVRCSDGVEKRIAPTPDGVLATIDVYYEPSCTHRLAHAVLNTLQFIPGRIVIANTFETYTLGGSRVGYGKSLSTTLYVTHGSRSSMTGSISLAPGRAALEDFTLTCAPDGSCDFEATTNGAAAHTSLRFVETIKGLQEQSDGSGPIEVAIKSGDMPVAHLTGQFRQSAANAALTANGSISLTDASGNRVTISSGTRSGVSGSLVAPSVKTPAATFSAGAAGNGTVNYRDGGSDRIDAFVIRT